MDEPSNRTEAILNQISDQLGRCWHALAVVKNLYAAFHAKKVVAAQSFFSASYRYCLESSVLAFARVALRDSDSVNIWYLLNCVENNPEELPNLPKDVVLASVQEFKNDLERVRPLFDVVRQQRDRVIAHLDRRIINTPEVMYNQVAISIPEFEEAFQLVLGIIQVYYRALKPSIEYHLDDISPTVEQDEAYLISLMKDDNRSKTHD